MQIFPQKIFIYTKETLQFREEKCSMQKISFSCAHLSEKYTCQLWNNLERMPEYNTVQNSFSFCLWGWWGGVISLTETVGESGDWTLGSAVSAGGYTSNFGGEGYRGYITVAGSKQAFKARLLSLSLLLCIQCYSIYYWIWSFENVWKKHVV